MTMTIQTPRFFINAQLSSSDEAGQNGNRANILALSVSSAFIATAIALLLVNTMTHSVYHAMLFVAWLSAFILSTLSSIDAIKKYVSTAALVLIALILAITLALPDTRLGLFSLFNGIIAHCNETFTLYIPLIPQAGTAASSIFYGILAGIIAGIAAWFTTRVRTSGILVLILAILCTVSASMSLGYVVAAASCGVIGWLIHCRFTQLRTGSYALSLLLITLAVCAAASFAIMFAGAATFTPSSVVYKANESFMKSFDELRFGKEALPEGNLTLAATMNQGNQTLEVTTDGAVSDDMLLRGYVGATFDGTSWNALDYTAYEGNWAGMMPWIRSTGLTPAYQRAQYDEESIQTGNTIDTAINSINVTVNTKNTGKRYVYAPYTLSFLDGSTASIERDAALRSFLYGSDTYQFSFDDIPTSLILDDSSWLATDTSGYATAESVYAAFVRDTYLSISAEDKTAITEYLFNDATWDNAASESSYAVISRVRTMLDTLASYNDTSVARYGTGNDQQFVRWFLGQEREGNSSYFATAATLAFRAQNIPARYVEGYRASRSNIAQAAASGEPVVLGAEDVHAWVEIYLDGLGWTPVEVTPGFYSQSYEADTVINVTEAKSTHSSDTLEAGSVAGDVAQDENNDTSTNNSFGANVLIAILWVVVILLLLVAAVFIQRFIRIKKLVQKCESNNQSVSVPTLYAYLATIMKNADIGFLKGKPLECLDQFNKAFPTIDFREYKRVIEIHQAAFFGERELRPNEMRTLRHFTQRLHESLQKPITAKKRLRAYFVDLL